MLGFPLERKIMQVGRGRGNGVPLDGYGKLQLLDFQKNIIKIKLKDGYDREWEWIKL